ncbi:hypothetical protein D7D25_14070 [Proteiniphilum sp. X52]|nr:hypothetical protein D7D25_14070 [Proteiniphilum sp. X52]
MPEIRHTFFWPFTPDSYHPFIPFPPNCEKRKHLSIQKEASVYKKGEKDSNIVYVRILTICLIIFDHP